MQKHKPLVKPMIVTTTDSFKFIISILGPFYANERTNDALNLRFMLKPNEENMLSWFKLKKDDSLFLDGGFHDLIDFLNDIGISTKFSAFFFLLKRAMSLAWSRRSDRRLSLSTLD